jgi:hypothetical protein
MPITPQRLPTILQRFCVHFSFRNGYPNGHGNGFNDQHDSSEVPLAEKPSSPIVSHPELHSNLTKVSALLR